MHQLIHINATQCLVTRSDATSHKHLILEQLEACLAAAVAIGPVGHVPRCHCFRFVTAASHPKAALEIPGGATNVPLEEQPLCVLHTHSYYHI